MNHDSSLEAHIKKPVGNYQAGESGSEAETWNISWVGWVEVKLATHGGWCCHTNFSVKNSFCFFQNCAHFIFFDHL